MELSWFGRYRRLVAEIIYFSNCMNRSLSSPFELGEGICLNVQEWQTLENILEHENEHLIMADISSMLAIPQSTLTVITKKLVSNNLIEKYHLENNRKNVILRPTEKGRRLYLACCEKTVTPLFSRLFNQLEPLTEDQLSAITAAFKALNGGFLNNEVETAKLIRME